MQNFTVLDDIKAIIQAKYPDFQQPFTDKLRHEILQAILPYTAKIPHPASGQTLGRWQILAYVAGIDLTLVKWLESHLDAVSILAEIGFSDIPQGLGAVWASEGHPNPVHFEIATEIEMGYKADERNCTNSTVSESNAVTRSTFEGYNGFCHGVKAWCSGANSVDFAVMTFRNQENHAQLLLIDLKNNKHTLHIDNSQWQAVGMASTDTASISFQQTPARLVGTPNQYLTRAGFWHGAGGVAGCWYGATVAIADYLKHSQQQKPHAFKAMYLGEIATALAVTQQYFYYVANLMDTQPNQSHELPIRQLRQQTEHVARRVLEQTGQALGASPFCHNAHFARLSADLSVFIRQSHGAFDSQAIGELTANQPNYGWQL